MSAGSQATPASAPGGRRASRGQRSQRPSPRRRTPGSRTTGQASRGIIHAEGVSPEDARPIAQRLGTPGSCAAQALSRLARCAMHGGGDLPEDVTCLGVVDGILMVIHMTRREGRRVSKKPSLYGAPTPGAIHGTYNDSPE